MITLKTNKQIRAENLDNSKPNKERMKQIIRRSNDTGRMVAKFGDENIVNCYQKDVEELIIYIRSLEAVLDIESVTLY